MLPNQLFDPKSHLGLKRDPARVVLLEDSLFFGDAHHPATFCKQKLWLHRATMKRYQVQVSNAGHDVLYLDYLPGPNSLHEQIQRALKGIPKSQRVLQMYDPEDFLFEKRIRRVCTSLKIEVQFLRSPLFMNSSEENTQYRAGKKRWFMADYYKMQRKRYEILIDEEGEPSGGQWSFDEANRKKVPKKLLSEIPALPRVRHDEIDLDAMQHVQSEYTDHYGNLDHLYYPTSHKDARAWLKHFLKHRFENFGVYEDAIVNGESWLWHSVLTSSLNIGLLTPTEVIRETTRFADRNDVPINSLEGFIRQIIGWREFMRATYQDLGVKMRTTNHWQHTRPMPSCFYDATTGIPPVDDTISRLLDTGYCHHIERLMVLGGLMFLCEIDPDDIYRWFMELFIDSYDWVMVPNAYAMSQNAD
ncbi:MAG: cryptochrome/photolyase family protein, partial [Planctomycetota bacterium]